MANSKINKILKEHEKLLREAEARSKSLLKGKDKELYNKAWAKLNRNIRKVISEGFVIDFKVPETKVKRPTYGSLLKLEKLNLKVLEESKKYIKGKGVLSRKKLQVQDRLNKKPSSGKKLTSQNLKAFASAALGNLGFDTKGLTLETVKKIELINKSLINIVAQHGNSSKSDKRGLEKWAEGINTELATFLNNEAKVVNDAFKNLDTTWLDFSNYSSDGVGIRPFCEKFEAAVYELTHSNVKADFQEMEGDPMDEEAEKLISRGYSVEKMQGW